MRRRADECEPEAGKGEDRHMWTRGTVYINQEQTRGRSGTYESGGE